MTNKEILETFEDIFFEEDYVNSSRLREPEFSTSDYGFLHVKLFGGMNGWGEWKEYLYDLYELAEALETNGISMTVIKFETDVLDDVFYVELELRDLAEFYKGKPK